MNVDRVDGLLHFSIFSCASVVCSAHRPPASVGLLTLGRQFTPARHAVFGCALHVQLVGEHIRGGWLFFHWWSRSRMLRLSGDSPTATRSFVPSTSGYLVSIEVMTSDATFAAAAAVDTASQVAVPRPNHSALTHTASFWLPPKLSKTLDDILRTLMCALLFVTLLSANVLLRFSRLRNIGSWPTIVAVSTAKAIHGDVRHRTAVRFNSSFLRPQSTLELLTCSVSHFSA